MKKTRSLLKKGQRKTTSDFEDASSQWASMEPPAFESDRAVGKEEEQDGFPVSNQPIEPGSGKTQRPSILKWIFFVILIGYTLLSYYHVPILTWIGSLLVLEHPVKKADLIVCTPGAPFETGLMAADLHKKGMAKHIFIPQTHSSTALMLVNEKGGSYPAPGELLLSILQTLGVPAADCILKKQPSESIREEAEEVRKWVLDSGKSAFILVSPPWRSRRTWSIFEQTFEGDQVDIMMAPSSYSDFRADNWWKTEKNFHETILEFQKLLGRTVTQIF